MKPATCRHFPRTGDVASLASVFGEYLTISNEHIGLYKGRGRAARNLFEDRTYRLRVMLSFSR